MPNLGKVLKRITSKIKSQKNHNNEPTILSLHNELLLLVFSHVNQFDAVNIRLVNKLFYKLGTIKLLKSLYVYEPESKEVETPVSNSPNSYLLFSTKYTVVNGFNEFKHLLDTVDLHLVKYVVFCVCEPNDYSDYCFYYLTGKCPWIIVNVVSWTREMIGKQLSRVDQITQLFVKNKFYFNIDMQDNFSIKQLSINGTTTDISDPLDLIPYLKGLNSLFIEDRNNEEILDDFKKRGITNLKLNSLCLEVPRVSLHEMTKVFTLDTIFNFELGFYNDVIPYEDLHWLTLQMKRLRNIKLSFPNLLFERIMKQFRGQTLHQIELCSNESKIEITELEIVNLMKGFEHSLTVFAVSKGTTRTTGFLNYKELVVNTSPEGPSNDQLHEYFTSDKYPNLTCLGINGTVYIL